ncbi:MAG TPA: GAF domain-containing protein, partial [Fimbriimonadaceae bacterium]|nr:GAF domain-containing protein [Fimbriimonadaceae bacterium]
MLELLAKLGLLSMAGGALVFSDRAAAAHVLPVVLCGSLVALGCWLADRKGARNEGVAGLFAVADSAVIAVLLTLGGLADHLGFLTLAPIALAAARFGSLPTAMAPIAAAALVSAHGVLLGGPPRAALYAQALGVLTIGILLNHRRIVVTVTRDVVGPIQPLAPQEPDGFLALRENFRKLKDSYRDLERKSRRDRLTSALLESRLLGGSSFFSRLAQRLKEISGAESVMLYGVAERDGRLVVRSSSGAAPESLTDAALEVVLDSGPLHLMESASRSIAALLNDEERPHFATVPLFHEGNVIGMAVAYHSRKSHLDECRACLEETSSVAAAMIVEEADRSAQRLRLKELETLYALACVSAGAGTANTLAARVARELKSTLEVDHVGIHWVDDGESIAASIEGLKAKFLDALSFAEGSGLQGWLSTGSPELVMLSTAEDARCTPEITLKRRVGSFCLFPIYVSNEVTGYITAATKRALG